MDYVHVGLCYYPSIYTNKGGYLFFNPCPWLLQVLFVFLNPYNMSKTYMAQLLVAATVALIVFLAHLAKGNVSFCHPSSVNFSHFNLLL